MPFGTIFLILFLYGSWITSYLYLENIFQERKNAKGEIVVKYGEIATCHNNCKGVDPSAIIGAGVAAVTLTALSGTSVLPAIGGAVGLGGVGAVGFMEMLRQQQQCMQTQCRVSYKL